MTELEVLKEIADALNGIRIGMCVIVFWVSTVSAYYLIKS